MDVTKDETRKSEEIIDVNPYLTRKASMFSPYIDTYIDKKEKENESEKDKKSKKAIDRLKKLFGY